MNVACLGLFFASLALGLAACGGGDDDAGPFGPQGSSDTDTEDSKDDSPGNSFSGGDEDCAFRVKLTGGFDAAIDWRVGCSGFGGEGAMELGFTDAEAEGGAVFLISVSGIEEGETGTGFPATVSILGSTDDDTPLFHSTEEGDCSIDITSHEKREGALGAALYVAKGRVSCTEPATTFDGGGPIQIGEIEFEAEVGWFS